MPKTIILAPSQTAGRHLANELGLPHYSRDVVIASTSARLRGLTVNHDDTVTWTPGYGPHSTRLRALALHRELDICRLGGTTGESVTAADAGSSLSIDAVHEGASVTASTVTRTLSGGLVRYGVPGRTSRGRLRVAPGALRFPADLSRVKLTKEHDRDDSRGHMAGLEAVEDGIRASMKVSDGPEGDAALREAADHTRDAFSFDVVDARIVGDTIVDALVIAVGQVGIPAYDDMRIDTVAASQHTANNQNGTPMTEAQRARLVELRAQQNRTDAQQAELVQLEDLANQQAAQPATPQPAPAPAPAPQPTPQPGPSPAPGSAAPAAPAPAPASGTAPAGGAPVPASPAGPPSAPSPAPGTVQASFQPAVPGGLPAPAGAAAPASSSTQATPALDHLIASIVSALSPSGGGAQAITAALADVTYGDHNDVINAPAWSGELWSGLQYESQFTDLFSSGSLTALKGEGWRFKTKMVISDYAGDKTPIPTSTVETEPSAWAAARMAVGVDVDRAFYDFPNATFLRSLAEQVRESWAMKLDVKVLAYALSKAVAAEGVAAQPTLFKAAGVAMRALKRRRVGRASWVLVNDDDLFTLLDYDRDSVPAFLELFGLDPRNFRSSQDVPAGTVVAGVRQAATVRTLPGSPIRVSAQHLANGGVDDAWFGYWAIEEHHTAGIAKATFQPEPL